MTSKLNSNSGSSDIAISFSKHAHGYDKHAVLQKIMAKRLALFLPDEIHERVLEIGCGTGLFTKYLLSLEPKYLFLNDISIQMINQLKTKFTLPSSTQTLVGDAEGMKFELVNLVAANAVFQWFKSPQETLMRLNSYIKPGGKIIFSTFGPDTLAEFCKSLAIESPANLISFNNWKKLIKKAGFTLISSANEGHKTLFNNTLDLLKSIQQIGAAPYRKISPGELRRLIKKYDENHPNKSAIHVKWEIFYFSAINKQ